MCVIPSDLYENYNVNSIYCRTALIMSGTGYVWWGYTLVRGGKNRIPLDIVTSGIGNTSRIDGLHEGNPPAQKNSFHNGPEILDCFSRYVEQAVKQMVALRMAF